MEFRLIYKGSLPAQKSGRSKEKHAIRKQLHWQLRDLWHNHNFLSRYTREMVVSQPGDAEEKRVTNLNDLRACVYD